jgi:hypothetical protein
VDVRPANVAANGPIRHAFQIQKSFLSLRRRVADVDLVAFDRLATQPEPGGRHLSAHAPQCLGAA